MSIELTIEQKVVFAVAPQGQGDGVPVVVLGIPEGAWEYMSKGKTHTFDLTMAGVPVKLILFGGKDHSEVFGILDKTAQVSNTPYLNRMRDDFSMKP
jgi:hypothetical protein